MISIAADLLRSCYNGTCVQHCHIIIIEIMEMMAEDATTCYVQVLYKLIIHFIWPVCSEIDSVWHKDHLSKLLTRFHFLWFIVNGFWIEFALLDLVPVLSVIHVFRPYAEEWHVLYIHAKFKLVLVFSNKINVPLKEKKKPASCMCYCFIKTLVFIWWSF